MFSEDPKKTISMMRVMSFLSFIMGSAVAIYGMSKSIIDYSGLTMLVSIFIGAAFSGKLFQKQVEVKKNVKTKT